MNTETKMIKFDENNFEIIDLYDTFLADYESYVKDYEEQVRLYGADGYADTPEVYRERLFGNLKRGEKYILTRYKGCAEEVIIPEGVTIISNKVFYNNTVLKRIYIPDTVTKIRENIFTGCTALEKVRLSDNINRIPWNAFENCTSLKNIKLPEKLKVIDLNCFKKSGIERLYIPASVEHISGSAFSYCDNLKIIEVDPENKFHYSQDNCIYYTKFNQLIVGRNGGELPDDGSIPGIGPEAFEGNLNITVLNVPKGVKFIDSAAFRNCKNLRRVTLPDTLESIGACSFEGCTSLEEIVIPASVVQVERHAFSGSGVKKVILKRGVKEIGDCAFANCNNLRELYIPSSAADVSSSMFGFSDNCNKYLRVYIETGVEKNYEKWIESLSGCQVIKDCNGEIFN